MTRCPLCRLSCAEALALGIALAQVHEEEPISEEASTRISLMLCPACIHALDTLDAARIEGAAAELTGEEIVFTSSPLVRRSN